MADTETPEKTQPTVNNSEFISQIAKKINESDNILVTLSRDPSVDEITAALGLTIFLDKLGKHATAIYSGRTPNMLQFLKPEETFETNTNSLQDFIVALNKDKADHLRYSIDGDYVKIFITPYKTNIEESDLEFSHGDYNIDLVIALNVPTPNDLDAALTEHGRIMHDVSAIDITTGQPGKFGEIEWSNPSASSVSEMAADLVLSIQNAKTPMGQAPATAFLTGIIVETKRFANEKTTPKTMNISSELMKLGADQQLITTHLEEDDTTVNAVSATEEDDDPTRLSIEHDQVNTPPQTEAPSVNTAEVVPDSNMIPPAPQVPSETPQSQPETAEHGKPNLTPSPEMEAQAQAQNPPEAEFVAVSQSETQPVPQPEAVTPPVTTPPVSEPQPAPQPAPMPEPQPTPEPAPTPTEPPLAGAVDLSSIAESATMSEAFKNETPPAGSMSDTSLIAPDKKPLDVPAPSDKDYGKMIDEALAETTLQGDAPIEPTQPIVTNMAEAAAPPVMDQPEANSVPDIAYDQVPAGPEPNSLQPVPVPEMETLPPPPPPPIPQMPSDVQPEAQPQPAPQPETQPQPEVQPQPEPMPQPEAQPQSEPVSQPEPQAQQPTEPQPTPTTPPVAEGVPAQNLTPDMFQIPNA